MGMNLSDFGSQTLKEKQEKQNVNNSQSSFVNSNSRTGNQNSTSKEGLTDQINSMQNMSEGDLTQKLWDEVNKSKSNGTFDYQQISKTVEGFKGMMPEESFNNLKRLLEQIK